MSNDEYSQRIAEIEKRRFFEQASLDGRLSAADRNRLGQFATPHALAQDILGLARCYITPDEPIYFLDPAVGTGVFFGALLETFNPERVCSATGFDVHKPTADIANELWGPFGLRVRWEDFTKAAEPERDLPRFNLVVCNPPYSRHHHLSSEIKNRLKRLVAQRVGLSVNGLAGLYCYFVLLADAWLANKGVALWLVPAEFLDVNYGSVLRQYLSTRVTLRRLHRFNTEDVQFSDALVSSCVIAFEKALPSSSHEVEFSGGGSLHKPDYTTTVPVAELVKAHKWGQFTIENVARVQTRLSSPRLRLCLGDLFEVKRGVATGANEFFILDVERARELGLPVEFLLPILPSPRYLSSDYIRTDESGWPIVPRRLALLNCNLPRHVVKHSHPQLDYYLRSGETSGITGRYLLRKRTPWYKQEDRPAAPILCTYMGRAKIGRSVFRFFRNYSKATAPNVYLMLYPKRRLQGAESRAPGILDRVFLTLRQLSDEECLGEGRTYGGGLSKLEPRELARVRLPLDDVDVSALTEEAQTGQLGLFPRENRALSRVVTNVVEPSLCPPKSGVSADFGTVSLSIPSVAVRVQSAPEDTSDHSGENADATVAKITAICGDRPQRHVYRK